LAGSIPGQPGTLVRTPDGSGEEAVEAAGATTPRARGVEKFPDLEHDIETTSAQAADLCTRLARRSPEGV